MKIFMDTEFTELSMKAKLISIGCISEDGKIFYAEFNDYGDELSDFVKSEVIPNLKMKPPGPGEQEYYNASRSKDNPQPDDIYKGYDCEMRGSTEEIEKELYRWLYQFNDMIEIVLDVGFYDFVLFQNIFGGAFKVPYPVTPIYIDLNDMIADYYSESPTTAFARDREIIKCEFISKEDNFPPEKHNALYDAKLCKFIYEMLIDAAIEKENGYEESKES